MLFYLFHSITLRKLLDLNIQTRISALNFLYSGGAVGIFPGGTVSTSTTPFGVPMDPSWRSFTAKMITKSGARVVPIFFEGHNSRTFQLASHIHNNLRLGLLMRRVQIKGWQSCL